MVWIVISAALAVALVGTAWVASRKLAALRLESEGHRALAEEQRRRADLHERRANEFFGIIEGVEKEADTWRGMYRDGMAKAGAAQNWLFRDLSDMVKRGNAYAAQLRKHGQKAPPLNVSPQLEQFLERFEREAGEAEVPKAAGHADAERIDRELTQAAPKALEPHAEADERA